MFDAYIVAATRIPGGKRGGRLRNWHPVDMGAVVIDRILDQTGVDPAAIDDVIFGCVTQVTEQAWNVARYCAMVSRLPDTVPGVTVDRQCGSSQQALQFAVQAVMSGTQDMVIAGGVESMTRVPASSAVFLGMEKNLGVPESPGLEAKYPGFVADQFAGAEALAWKYDISKDDADAFALESHRRASAAVAAGAFVAELTPVDGVDTEGGVIAHDIDEGIRASATIEAIQAVKLLREGGIVTAANASQICDGASAMLVVNERALKAHGLVPLARIHHVSVLGGDPVIMLETPIAATQRALEKVGMSIDAIDLYEVNEAFAPVPLSWLKVLDGDRDKLNVNGGAIALGHPLGASGTKLGTTLVHALRARKKRFGLQTMCEGGGLANVTIYEAL